MTISLRLDPRRCYAQGASEMYPHGMGWHLARDDAGDDAASGDDLPRR